MNLSAIDLRHLRYFIAVVEQGSFRAAALKLHISQPPLTRQIQQVEGAVGATLLIRKPRGVEMTTAGRVFYREARNILMLVERAANQARLTAAGQIGRLDIGIYGSAVFGAIPRIVRAFQERYPDVDIALYTMGRTEQLRALRERRLTLGFNRFFQHEPDLAWEPVQTEHINVAIDSAHPLASRKSLSLTEIAGQPLILYPRSPRPGFIDKVLKALEQQDVTPHSLQEVDDVPTAIALVDSGRGVSFVTDSACNLRLPNVSYVPLVQGEFAQVDLCIAHRKDDHSTLLACFLDVARALRPSLSSPPPASTPTVRRSQRKATLAKPRRHAPTRRSTPWPTNV
ncbi:MAG: LysR family transcriptional regulator [Nevskiaceae bacterium]|nr:MAG: LysR family transcriptional regulator [Nevskiaceae bacterium]TBR72667.1 MAG: LysR family transcriptional regulator [Nevskiaceae bacterium]